MINASCDEKRCGERLEYVSRGWATPETSCNADLSTLSRRLCSVALLETQADRPGTMHDDGPSSLQPTPARNSWRRVRNASNSPYLHKSTLAGGCTWTLVQSCCHFFVSFLRYLIRASNSWLSRRWSTIILSSISPPRLDDKFILIFSDRESLSKCFAFPWKHQACNVKKKGKRRKKRENSTSSDTKVRSRSLQQKPGDAVAFSRRAPEIVFTWMP